MARYKLENALRATKPKEYKSDGAAWNGLRKIWADKDVFICLWKEVEIEVPINNEEKYVKEHNSFYGPPPFGYGDENAKLMVVGEKNVSKIWIPVLEGITSHPYNVTKKLP